MSRAEKQMLKPAVSRGAILEVLAALEHYPFDLSRHPCDWSDAVTCRTHPSARWMFLRLRLVGLQFDVHLDRLLCAEGITPPIVTLHVEQVNIFDPQIIALRRLLQTGPSPWTLEELTLRNLNPNRSRLALKSLCEFTAGFRHLKLLDISQTCHLLPRSRCRRPLWIPQVRSCNLCDRCTPQHGAACLWTVTVRKTLLVC